MSLGRRRIDFILAPLVAAALQIPAGGALAAGFGAYFEYGRAWGTMDDALGSPAFDYDEDQFGVGFVLDTAVAQDRVFNYRLNLGYERINQHFDSGPELMSNGMAMSHTFGFGIVRTHRMRVWLGPAIRFGFDVVTDTGAKVWDIDMGGGPAMGVNFHLGDRVSIGLTGGYHYLYHIRIDGRSFVDETFDNGQHLGFLRLSFMSRTGGDRFQPRSARSASP